MRRTQVLFLAALLVAAVVAAEEAPAKLRLEDATTPSLSKMELPVQDAAAQVLSYAQNEIVAIALAGLVVFIAAGGGTGGGGVLNPIYILIMGLDPKVRGVVTCRRLQN
jgi:hypothetical protein